MTLPTVEEMGRLTVAELRARMPGWLDEHVADVAGLRARVGGLVRAALDASTDKELDRSLAEYRTLGSEYRFYGANPAVRRIGRAFIREMAAPAVPRGIERLRAACAAGPCLLVANHLSYSDSQLTDHVLCSAGAADLADRLLFVAGPKVYEEPFRRTATLGLNTLKTAQSTRIAHPVEAISARDIARIAKETVRTAAEYMARGYTVVIYGEGGRSRTGRFGSFLGAISRYATAPGTRIVPFALSGSDRVLPIHQQVLGPAPVTLAVGEAVPTDAHGPADALSRAWQQIAEMLPPDYRPEPGTPPVV